MKILGKMWIFGTSIRKLHKCRHRSFLVLPNLAWFLISPKTQDCTPVVPPTEKKNMIIRLRTKFFFFFSGRWQMIITLVINESMNGNCKSSRVNNIRKVCEYFV